MTDTNTPQHPLTLAGLGRRGPYSIWTAIRLPPARLAATDPAVAGRRRRRIRDEARWLHVPESDACGMCGQPQDVLYVAVDASNRPVAALCRACVEGTGDSILVRKMRHLDHEHQRALDRVSPARKRCRR